jgi:hypothetical protein
MEKTVLKQLFFGGTAYSTIEQLSQQIYYLAKRRRALVDRAELSNNLTRQPGMMLHRKTIWWR